MNGDVLRQTGIQNLVPPDHTFPVFRNNRLEPFVEVRLEATVILNSKRSHEFLDPGIGIPVLSVHLVTADVKETIRKKPGHLADKPIEELVGLLPCGIERRIQNAPTTFDFIRTRGACEFRVAHEPGGAVARQVELGNDANSAVTRIRNQAADFILGIVEAVGAQFVEPWKRFAFHAKALVVRQVPVEDVHFDRFHAVEISTDHIERNEMPDRIDHESAPRKARPILNCQGWDGKSFRRYIDQLEKRLKSMQRSERRRRSQPGAGWSDFENIRFVFSDFLDFFAGVIGLEYASIFAALGVRVTVVDKRHRLLPFVDAEIIDTLAYHLRENRVTLRLGEEAMVVRYEHANLLGHQGLSKNNGLPA